jgi:hypothetical protein
MNSGLPRISELAIQRHIVFGEKLLLLCFSSEKNGDNTHFLFVSEGQSLCLVPSGAGGTRWREFVKCSDLSVCKKYITDYPDNKSIMWLTKVEPYPE